MNIRAKHLLLLVCTSVFYFSPDFSRAQQVPSSNAISSAQSASNYIDPIILKDFQRWTESYATAGKVEKSQLLGKGLKLATERRPIFAELIQSTPEEALRQAVPVSLRQQLPAEIVALLEEPVSGNGDFLVIATVPSPGSEKSVRPIERFAILRGKRYQAFVYGRQLTQITRTNTPLRGVAIDGKLALEDNSQLKDGDGSRPKSAWTFGIKKVLFIRVNFPDDPAESISMAQAVTMMNYSSNWFETVSYHNTGLNATITPLLTLSGTKASYQSSGDYVGLLDDARAVAKANGFDTANFDLDCVHFQPVFPGWGGRAYVGSKGMWIQSYYHVGITCHEFGHNYGLWHANAWSAFDDTIIGPGTHVEYGNYFDTMGSNEDNSASEVDAFQFNAYEKNLLGWLPDGNVVTVTTSGVYRVYAFDVPSLNTNAFHALRIRKDDTRYYWAELRSLFSGSRWADGGLILNWSPWQNSNGGTHILDANPATTFGWNDAAVVVGQTFTEPFADFHLTVLRKNTNTTPASLDVMVQFGPFPSNHPPTVTVTASSTNVAQNVPVTFTATASDPDGDELAYYWEFNNDDSSAPLAPNAPDATTKWTFYGHYPVRCTVSDRKGGTATALVFMNVGSPAYYTIRGRIEHLGAPVEGVRVSGSPSLPFYGYTDANGNYILGYVPAGSPRTLSAVKPGWTFSPANFSNPVTVSSSVSNFNFSGAPLTYSISGSILDSGQLVPGVNVSAGGTNSTVTDGNGFYVLANLFAGVYNLTASKPGYEFRPQNWANPVVVDWQDIFGKHFDAQLASLLTQMRVTNGGFAFRLSGGSNRIIRIEASTNLATWLALATVTNTTGQLDFVDAPFSTPSRFYRAALLP